MASHGKHGSRWLNSKATTLTGSFPIYLFVGCDLLIGEVVCEMWLTGLASIYLFPFKTPILNSFRDVGIDLPSRHWNLFPLLRLGRASVAVFYLVPACPIILSAHNAVRQLGRQERLHGHVRVRAGASSRLGEATTIWVQLPP